MSARMFLVIIFLLSIAAANAQSAGKKKPVPAIADTAKRKFPANQTPASPHEKYDAIQPDSVLKPAGTVSSLKSSANEVSMESMERRKPGNDSVKPKAIQPPKAPQSKNEVSIETIEFRKQPVSPAKKKQKPSHPPQS